MRCCIYVSSSWGSKSGPPFSYFFADISPSDPHFGRNRLGVQREEAHLLAFLVFGPLCHLPLTVPLCCHQPTSNKRLLSYMSYIYIWLMIYFTFSPMSWLLTFIQPLIAYSCHSHDDAFRHHSLVIEVKVVSLPSQPTQPKNRISYSMLLAAQAHYLMVSPTGTNQD